MGGKSRSSRSENVSFVFIDSDDLLSVSITELSFEEGNMALLALSDDLLAVSITELSFEEGNIALLTLSDDSEVAPPNISLLSYSSSSNPNISSKSSICSPGSKPLYDTDSFSILGTSFSFNDCSDFAIIWSNSISSTSLLVHNLFISL